MRVNTQRTTVGAVNLCIREVILPDASERTALMSRYLRSRRHREPGRRAAVTGGQARPWIEESYLGAVAGPVAAPRSQCWC